MAVAAALMAMFLSVACGPAAGRTPTPEGSPDAHATIVAAATAGLLPEGLIIATATPDLHAANKISAESLRERLSREPALARLFEAIDARDAGALMALIAWQRNGCGGHLTPTCPRGTPPGTPVELLTTPPDSEGGITRDEATPLFDAMLAGIEPLPAFVAQSNGEPARYLVGFKVTTEVHQPGAIGDPSELIGGVLFWVDASAAEPIQTLELAPPRLESDYGMQAARDGDYLVLLFTQYEYP